MHQPKIGVAVLIFLRAALALAVACSARAPSMQEPSAPSPPRQHVDVPASGSDNPSPALDALPSDTPVLAEPAPEDQAFHREITLSTSRPTQIASANALAAAVRRNNVFSFALWKVFAERDNFVVSPYSIRSALGFVYQASGGETRKRLQSLLMYPERTDDLAISALDAAARVNSETRLDSVSSLWIANGTLLRPPYLQRLADLPRAQVHTIDFRDRPMRAWRFINTWMSTHGGSDTIETFPESTGTSGSSTVLVDTQSFAGTWPPKFMLAEGLHAWTDQNGTVGRVTMDMAYGGKCKAIFNDSATASLHNCTGSFCREAVDAAIADYQDSSLSLMVVKPESWKEFIWNENSFLRIWSALRKAPEMDFNFPIIKLLSVRDLKQPLMRLGARASDLSLSQGAVARTTPELSLDRMVHQASFQVDAGSPKREPTAEELEEPDSWDEEPRRPYFTTDYAFYFLVLERQTGLILQMGQVVEPPSFRSNRQRDRFAPRVPGAAAL